MLRYLLDTNIAIFVIRRRPPLAAAVFNQHAGRMAVSAITLAELMHGAEKSSRPAANLAVVEDFCSRLEVLPTGRRRRNTTGRSAPRSSWRARPSASTTCMSPRTHAARGW